MNLTQYLNKSSSRGLFSFFSSSSLLSFSFSVVASLFDASTATGFTTTGASFLTYKMLNNIHSLMNAYFTKNETCFNCTSTQAPKPIHLGYLGLRLSASEWIVNLALYKFSCHLFPGIIGLVEGGC